MKIATIEAEFSELKGNNRATGRGEASTARAAVSRAFGDLMKQDNVRHKRISQISATIHIVNKVPTPQ
jgi:hypothetical protein